jgi:hypothetical protein
MPRMMPPIVACLDAILAHISFSIRAFLRLEHSRKQNGNPWSDSSSDPPLFPYQARLRSSCGQTQARDAARTAPLRLNALRRRQ